MDVRTHGWTMDEALDDLLETPGVSGRALMALWLSQPSWAVSPPGLSSQPSRLQRSWAIWNDEAPAPSAPFLGLPVTRDEAWPMVAQGASGLDGREGFVAALIAHGEDPWAPDEDGCDAWDHAVTLGLVSVLDQLWRHPGRPLPDTLWTRRWPLSSRHGSALHVAVSRSHHALARQLLNYGHPVNALDSKRGLPLSVLAKVADLAVWAELGLVPQDLGRLRAIKASWLNQARTTQVSFSRTEAHAALASLTAMNVEVQVSEAWASLLHEWLSTPYAERFESFPSLEQLTASSHNAATYRYHQKSGPLRGRWPIVGAWAMGLLRSAGGGDAHQVEAWAMELARYTEADRQALLASEIRPGFPLIGLLRLVCVCPSGFVGPQGERAGVDWLMSCEQWRTAENAAPSRVDAETELAFKVIEVTRALFPDAKAQASKLHRRVQNKWTELLKQWGLWSDKDPNALPSIFYKVAFPVLLSWIEALDHPYFCWPEEMLSAFVLWTPDFAQHKDWDGSALAEAFQRMDGLQSEWMRERLAIGPLPDVVRRVEAYHGWLDWAEAHLDAPRWEMVWPDEATRTILGKPSVKSGQFVRPHYWFSAPEDAPQNYWVKRLDHAKTRYAALAVRDAVQVDHGGTRQGRTRL